MRIIQDYMTWIYVVAPAIVLGQPGEPLCVRPTIIGADPDVRLARKYFQRESIRLSFLVIGLVLLHLLVKQGAVFGDMSTGKVSQLVRQDEEQPRRLLFISAKNNYGPTMEAEGEPIRALCSGRKIIDMKDRD